jgi:hypothetical protein
LLELVPVRDEEERQVVLTAVNYYDEGMTPFDAFHAATAETRGMDVSRPRKTTRTSRCRESRWNQPTRSSVEFSATLPALHRVQAQTDVTDSAHFAAFYRRLGRKPDSRTEA